MFDNQNITFTRPDSPKAPYEIALKKFNQLHFTSSAVDGLQFMASSPAFVAFIESDCKEMTGIAIAEATRDIDDLTCLVPRLQSTNLLLQADQLLDPLIGLGHRKLAEQSLNDSIRQIESRGGAV